LVGHSLGGFLSLMCAARHPQPGGHPIRGVVMLDAPILGGWKAAALSVAKRARLVGSISPGAVSRKRKQSWASLQEVQAHFAGKKLFAPWDPAVLQDYITQGTRLADPDGDADGPRVLSFDRDIETAIYNTLPDNLEALLKRHPPQCPVTFIGGRNSLEMRQVGMDLTEKVTHGRIMMLDGSHLFPMERPEASAAAIEAAVLNLMSPSGRGH
jgi:pimeloyl-ACP methyl ester carboxylesterase